MILIIFSIFFFCFYVVPTAYLIILVKYCSNLLEVLDKKDYNPDNPIRNDIKNIMFIPVGNFFASLYLGIRSLEHVGAKCMPKILDTYFKVNGKLLKLFKIDD